MKTLTEKEALQKAAALCAGAEYCLSDIRTKLTKWGMNETQASSILDRLLKEQFIDESRYARAYARDKLRYNKWGKLKIAQGLRLKQIASSLVKEAIDSIDEEEYRQIARQVLLAKRPSVKGKNDYERRMKLLRYAAGKGFEPSVLQPLLSADDDEYPDTDWP